MYIFGNRYERNVAIKLMRLYRHDRRNKYKTIQKMRVEETDQRLMHDGGYADQRSCKKKIEMKTN